MTDEEIEAFVDWIEAERRKLVSADCECRVCGEIVCECES